jgi:hypothetical protein
MSRLSIARHAALVAIAVAGVCGVSSIAAAQRTTPRHAFGPRPTPPRVTVPYPGATVIIDPRVYQQQRGFRPGRRRQNHGGYPQEPIYYYPNYYPPVGYAIDGGLYDVNGQPVSGYDAQAVGPTMGMASPSDFPMATPDLSGSPYTVIDGGAMVVNFGNGDRRAVPSCASVEKASTPDGQPRTIFYHPPAYALVLRAGQRGQVLGRPAAGAKVCYTMDAYGRTVLAY